MRVLIAYDGSDTSDLAIEDLSTAGLPAEVEAVVLTVGEVWDLPVTADRVSADSGRFVHPTTRLVEKHLAEVSERARSLAESAARRVSEIFPSWNVSAEGLCGKPAVELIKRADEWSPDLLVVGSHGRSAIGRLFLGSVSLKVLHEARCSLRIARRNEYGEYPSERILVGVDGSPNAELVVETVAARKWAQNTEIRLIAVDDPFTQPTAAYILWNLEDDRPEDNEQSRKWISEVIERPGEILRRAGLQVSHSIRWGDPGNMILQEASDWKPDAIFVGARGTGRLKRFLLGSVSSAVAEKAKCSVEVVRPKNQR